MSTTRSKDRAGLCSFTFANGHRCRSLCSTSHPHLCYYHARKESQARAADQIGRDISYFFSGRYLSACDLSAVLARLFSAVASGELQRATRAPALRRCPTDPSVFTACPGSATPSVRPCPATQLEQPARTGIVPPETVILTLQRISGIEASQPILRGVQIGRLSPNWREINV